MKRHNQTFGGFVMGFFFGGLVGAAVALLMAPQSGEETRDQIQEEAERLRTQMTKAMDDMRSSLDTTSEEVRKRAEETLEAARARIDTLQAQGKTVVQEGRERFGDAVEGVKKVAASVG